MVASLNSSGRAGDVVGVLDIGTAKTVCLIVSPQRARVADAMESVRVLGVGLQPSKGLKAGVVVELTDAEEAVRAAVEQAERAAGVVLEGVILSVACGRLKSSTFTADTGIEGRVAGSADIDRLMGAARTYAERDGRTVLHMNCLSYRLDSTAGIADPRGLAGQKLGADLHAVTADDAPVRNMLHVIERAYLRADGLVPAPYASSLAATTAEERRLGAICVDIGAGATGLSMFAEGHLLSNEVIPVGGNHITFDIARAVPTSLAEAERIKKEYGTLARVASDDQGAITYMLAGGEQPALHQVSRAKIRDIVGGRMTGILGHVAERIGRLGFPRHVMERVVLTGGASQLHGLSEFAAEFLGRPVRVARLMPAGGLPASYSGPAFSAAVGLVHAALDPAAGVRSEGSGLESAGYLGRMSQWLRESF